VIRKTVEELAPPNSVPNHEYLGPEPMKEKDAEAIIRGIHAIAERSRSIPTLSSKRTKPPQAARP
jgi:hypothetical protein